MPLRKDEELPMVWGQLSDDQEPTVHLPNLSQKWKKNEVKQQNLCVQPPYPSPPGPQLKHQAPV